MAMDMSNSLDSNSRSSHDCLLSVMAGGGGGDAVLLEGGRSGGDDGGSSVSGWSTWCGRPESQLPSGAGAGGTAVGARCCGRSTSVTRPLSTDRLRLSAECTAHHVTTAASPWTLTRRSDVIVTSPPARTHAHASQPVSACVGLHSTLSSRTAKQALMPTNVPIPSCKPRGTGNEYRANCADITMQRSAQETSDQKPTRSRQHASRRMPAPGTHAQTGM